MGDTVPLPATDEIPRDPPAVFFGRRHLGLFDTRMNAKIRAEMNTGSRRWKRKVLNIGSKTL